MNVDDETKNWLYSDFASLTRKTKVDEGMSSRPTTSRATPRILLPGTTEMMTETPVVRHVGITKTEDTLMNAVYGVDTMDALVDPILSGLLMYGVQKRPMFNKNNNEEAVVQNDAFRNQLLMMMIAVVYHGRRGDMMHWIATYFNGNMHSEQPESRCYVTDALRFYSDLQGNCSMINDTAESKIFHSLMALLSKKIKMMDRDFDALNFSDSMSDDCCLAFVAAVCFDMLGLFQAFPTLDLRYFVSFMVSGMSCNA